MELTIRWDKRASDALTSILEWQEEHYDLKVAQKLYQKVKKTVLAIAKQPLCGKVAVELTNEKRAVIYRTFLVSKHFRLIYFVENDTLNIVYVLDCRRDNKMIVEP